MTPRRRNKRSQGIRQIRRTRALKVRSRGAAPCAPTSLRFARVAAYPPAHGALRARHVDRRRRRGRPSPPWATAPGATWSTSSPPWAPTWSSSSRQDRHRRFQPGHRHHQHAAGSDHRRRGRPAAPGGPNAWRRWPWAPRKSSAGGKLREGLVAGSTARFSTVRNFRTGPGPFPCPGDWHRGSAVAVIGARSAKSSAPTRRRPTGAHRRPAGAHRRVPCPPARGWA